VSLTTIAQKWPSSLSQLNDQAIFLIARKASEKSDAAAVALLEPIHQFHWTPLDRFSKPDRLWLTLAKAYANLSDETHEIAALNDVHDGGLLVYVRGDKRFDGAVRANPSHYDVRAAIEAGRGPLLETLLCANDLDGAAKLIISELKEPSSRGDTLYTLQDYQDDLKATAIEKETRQRLLSVRNRPDVASAISAVGRVEAYPVLPPNT
jgi:hypothetical protein